MALPSSIDKTLLPHKPGVYIYKNKANQVIYVGKAIDLYSRVSSYFNSRSSSDRTKVDNLVSNIVSVETIIVESELEALILEANLIKKFLPPFNIRLTDDKDYLYIKVTQEPFPRVLTARKHDLKEALKYFGPFPSSRTVKETLKSLRRVFPWCQLGARKWGVGGRPCFYYHLKLCPGVCVGRVSEEEYRKNIKALSALLEGKKDQLVKELTSEMNQASKNQDFEKAQRVKKTLEGIHYLTQSNRTSAYLENPNFLEDERSRSLEELQTALHLKKLPERVECYDISNISGTNATGSMVVLTNGEIDKSGYRRFKIHISGKPNDVGMHREMMRRRLKHLEWPFPDLMIIDGGITQVRGAQLEIQNSKLEIPVFGLAKRMEWLYSPTGEIIKLSKKSGALKLVQKIRDEAHRFAITYHRKLRAKAFLPSH